MEKGIGDVASRCAFWLWLVNLHQHCGTLIVYWPNWPVQLILDALVHYLDITVTLSSFTLQSGIETLSSIDPVHTPWMPAESHGVVVKCRAVSKSYCGPCRACRSAMFVWLLHLWSCSACLYHLFSVFWFDI